MGFLKVSDGPNNGAGGSEPALERSGLWPFRPLGRQGAVRPRRALFRDARAQAQHRAELG